ncbi:substrate-binding domain-containing protein [Carboxydothermus ferrireducens]|uniref:Phosphonate transport system substrate-binding protein n=1 Tax=Carboxydothermus ferrireducens DSM 11255 TaxID=1119529 RepID=A0ABX2R9K7_9THEO|nr:phosphate/phosphite/phosphonate ABC transporter substrate-binding protein [Carboxydothermus ferrireducens]NYE56773.1 phosphonate transport system substrate-binding protein [Carboxydothermus ferrireducens DSM 11255]
MPKTAKVLLFALFIFSAFLSGCGQKDLPFVDLNKPGRYSASSSAKNDELVLKVAISSMTSPSESIVYYDELLKNLGRELGRKIKVIQKNSYFEVNDLLRTGQVDLAFICTYSYLVGAKQFGLELLVVPQVNGKPYYQSFVIVRNNSGIEKFSDLKGKIFAFTDPMSTTGYFYPQYLLLQNGTTDREFFKKFFFTYSHDNAIKAVAKGIADGAAVDSHVFLMMEKENPGLTRNLKIIARSPDYYAPPVVVRPGLPQDLKEKIKNYFLSLDKKPEGQIILRKIGVDRFVPGEREKYRSIELMTQKVITNNGRK